MHTSDGYPVVLTADRTLTANYRILFDGMLVANQTTTTPRPIVRALMMPRPHADGARAHVAPLGHFQGELIRICARSGGAYG